MVYNYEVMETITVGDLITLRKTHPCGGNSWRVVRLGADIGLECLTCGRKIFLPRHELLRRMKKEPQKEGLQKNANS